ncbi:unnamed protein product [Prorocentrum cordatum]|uniref:GYF domain-containing protein n=1 Tax=Prorocentrum cordatum TaxID=2364126 RepID=A0ABN9WXK7_9DINO|nr:unnamed protein product [Polarella glacialis]
MMRGELPENAAPTEAIEALRRLKNAGEDGADAADSGVRAREAAPRAVPRESTVAAALREPPKPVSQQPVNLYGDSKKDIPAKGWEYVDPKGKTQGPFTLEQMKKWFNKGDYSSLTSK